ncbi:type II toxin-antitoxin system Phd/YefM family antitoxin [Burkholderia dolosa]|jgi:antitoxin StbD|uniref:type II toxin-antitoxin system Phd/YefM family antitoxin n=1 Tax=Burkholderia dolosa TaxID=152500 RepID=UPI001BA2822A|nr:type II toxin-antitoxin system Phd/YefM family antitoxin [Burkholderia dolosa]MBR8461161.1 type II toxin-antitoxin system Phd/YefM family antitoxin [Burkholderia dolosa]MDN7420322.1 type II toxin-antitoxin system Phd/YefM family antitoxin [Burkholderia dolosa]
MTKHIHSLLTVSISEFKQSPAKVLEEVRDQPVAVLDHNRPALYAVSPKVMAEMAALYEECELSTLVGSRLKCVDHSIKVSTDDR